MIAKPHHGHDVEFDIIFHLTHIFREGELKNQWMINYLNHRFVAHMGKVLFATSIMNE